MAVPARSVTNAWWRQSGHSCACSPISRVRRTINRRPARVASATCAFDSPARRSENGKLWNIELSAPDGATVKLQARGLVNATGPWVKRFLDEQTHIKTGKRVRLIKGSHIVVPRLFEGDHAYILQQPDRRIVTKCDMCLPRLEEGLKPACVGACPTRALDVEAVDVTAWAADHAEADGPHLPPAGLTLSTTRIVAPAGISDDSGTAAADAAPAPRPPPPPPGTCRPSRSCWP